MLLTHNVNTVYVGTKGNHVNLVQWRCVQTAGEVNFDMTAYKADTNTKNYTELVHTFLASYS